MTEMTEEERLRIAIVTTAEAVKAALLPDGKKASSLKVSLQNRKVRALLDRALVL